MGPVRKVATALFNKCAFGQRLVSECCPGPRKTPTINLAVAAPAPRHQAADVSTPRSANRVEGICDQRRTGPPRVNGRQVQITYWEREGAATLFDPTSQNSVTNFKAGHMPRLYRTIGPAIGNTKGRSHCAKRPQVKTDAKANMDTQAHRQRRAGEVSRE